MNNLLFCLGLLCLQMNAMCQLPDHFKRSASLQQQLESIIRELKLDSSWEAGADGKEGISVALVQLKKGKAIYADFGGENFIYPASVYKMYVAMEVLKQVNERKYSLYSPYIVRSPNDVDKRKEIPYDPRPLLRNGDTVTVQYLLDLMITRSDNSAANCLIDLAGRKNINLTMHQYGWQGSEVTRKFLRRSYEDPGYDTIRGTETSGLHAVDFLYRIETGQLVNPWVSMQMKNLLGAQLDTTKLSAGFPPDVMFYHKTGWWSIYTHDVGIVKAGKQTFIVAVFLPLAEEKARPIMKDLAQKIYKIAQ